MQQTKTPVLVKPTEPPTEPTVTQVEPPPVTEPTPEPTVPRVDTASAKVKNASDSVPSNWAITPSKGNQIDATNIASGSTFKGTIDEFNAMLRS